MAQLYVDIAGLSSLNSQTSDPVTCNRGLYKKNKVHTLNDPFISPRSLNRKGPITGEIAIQNLAGTHFLSHIVSSRLTIESEDRSLGSNMN